MSGEIKTGDVCIHRRLRIAVWVESVDRAPFATCQKLNASPDNHEGNRFWPELDELVTVDQFCEEWSDFMTFTASVMNIAPKDEPANKSVVWHFWNLGRQARLHLLKWNVRQYLE